MSVINDFKKMYHEWRRQSLPPSSADSHSRHEVIVRRLDQIEQAITNRLPEIVSSPEELDYHALASRYALHRLTDLAHSQK
jgi:hypothetical protein